MLLKKISSDEINNIGGGACQCNCNRNPDTADSFIYVGAAKSLEECSNVCLANGWKIENCLAQKSKKKEKKESE